MAEPVRPRALRPPTSAPHRAPLPLPVPLPRVPAARVSPDRPPQVLLERELAKLSAELDKDLRAIETRQTSPKVPTSRPPPGDAAPRGPRQLGLGERGGQRRPSGCTRRAFGQTFPLSAPSSPKGWAGLFRGPPPNLPGRLRLGLTSRCRAPRSARDLPFPAPSSAPQPPASPGPQLAGLSVTTAPLPAPPALSSSLFRTPLPALPPGSGSGSGSSSPPSSPPRPPRSFPAANFSGGGGLAAPHGRCGLTPSPPQGSQVPRRPQEPRCSAR